MQEVDERAMDRTMKLDPLGGLVSLEQETLRLRRRERLRGELIDANLELPAASEAAILTEIDRARFPRRHERRFPTFGAITAHENHRDLTDTLDALGATRIPASPDQADAIRNVADGVQSFALIGPDSAELAVLANPAMREVDLVGLRRSLGSSAIVVCRWHDGTVRLVQHGQIAIFDGTRWWTKPDARTYTSSVCHAVPHAPVPIAQAMLDFCVHTLAPSPGGTILAWCLEAESLDRLRAHSVSTRPPPPIALSFARPVVHSTLRHLLAQVDGACAVDASGTAVEIGLHLRASAEADANVKVSPTRGTRHAAAKRCSYDIANAVFFVVSDDGPVTVYVRGETVASIELHAALDRDQVEGSDDDDNPIEPFEAPPKSATDAAPPGPGGDHH